MLDQAISLHRQGRLVEAAALYRRFLAHNPQHAEALGLLGVVEVQAGNLPAGIELIDRAIELDPKNTILFNNRGNALRDLKRYDEALISFDRALELKPDFAQVLHNRGNVLRDLRRFEEALESFDRALGLNPGFVLAHFNRGNALQEMGRFDAAVLSFDRALVLNPDHADAHNNRGIALHGLKRFDDALTSFERALAIRGGNPGYLNNRGNVLLNLKRYEDALASFDAALAIRRDYAEALCNRGIVLRELKRHDDALRSFDRAIALKPGYAEALCNRGVVLCDLNRLADAIVSLDRAIAIKPYYADAFLNRGVALREMRRPDDAIKSFDRALSFEANNADVFNARGVALQDLERFDEALLALDRALALKPDHAQAFYNRGMVLLSLKRPQETLASYARALALKPDYPDAEFGRGVCKLTMGELLEGWAGYEHRWAIKTPAYSRRSRDLPDWAGENLRGRSILVYAEQGFGDTIQFARYLPLLASQGAAVAFLADDTILRVLGGLSDYVSLISAVGPGDRFDFQCALMSLPHWFQTDLATIPAPSPYLRADSKRSAEWVERIGAHGFKIGIHWQGGLWQGGASIAGRSIPLRAFFPLSQIPDVRLISLQKNFGVEQLSHLPAGMGVETLGEGFDAGPDAFVDSASVMECLDLIVTCDTSIAHLAGALGRPTWVALKYVPDWRWMLDRSDSPWYPTMRLFRQRTWGDWRGVFQDIAAAVKNTVTAGGQSQL